MGAIVTKALADLEETTSRTTERMRDMVTDLANEVERLQEKTKDTTSSQPPYEFYGTARRARYGMNGLPDPCLRFTVEGAAVGKDDDDRMRAMSLIEVALYGSGATGFIQVNKLKKVSDLNGQYVMLKRAPSSAVYIAEVIGSLPVAYAANGQGLFIGDKVGAIADDDTPFTGVVAGTRGGGYIDIKRDDGVSGGGEQGSYVTPVDRVTKV